MNEPNWMGYAELLTNVRAAKEQGRLDESAQKHFRQTFFALNLPDSRPDLREKFEALLR